MYHIAFFVPENEVEKVKESMFQAGAGKVGNYARCSFETKGLGQFEALLGAKPAIGLVGQLEKVVELKVEMVCEETKVAAAIAALLKNHPYETPAYYVTKTVDCFSVE